MRREFAALRNEMRDSFLNAQAAWADHQMHIHKHRLLEGTYMEGQCFVGHPIALTALAGLDHRTRKPMQFRVRLRRPLA